jgi:hypothetical protein
MDYLNLRLYQNIFLHDFLWIIVSVSSFVIVCYYIKSIFHIVIINGKIESLHQGRDKEIEKQTSTPGVPSSINDIKREHITKEYQKKIDVLDRKKSYIIDILPWLPKK